MHKAVSRALWGAFFVGGLTVLGAGAANAADTSGEDGVASGNQVGVLGELPVTIGGNAISILGDSESSGTTVTPGGSDAVAPGSTTGGEDAILGGNQVMPDIVAPIVASGNSISVIGDSSTEGTTTTAPAQGSTDGTAATTGDDGMASGNQVAPAVDAPVTVTGNDVSVIRDDALTDNALGDVGLLDGTLQDGILNGGVLEDGILNGGVLNDGILNDGILNDGILNGGQGDGTFGDPVVRIGIIDDVLLAAPVGDDALLGESVAEGPFFGDIGLAVLTVDPVAVEGDAAVGGPDGVTEATTAVAGSGLTPLVATAALTPATMFATTALAATGIEALPLIGGIALMLVTGLALVGTKRLGHLMR